MYFIASLKIVFQLITFLSQHMDCSQAHGDQLCKYRSAKNVKPHQVPWHEIDSNFKSCSGTT